MKDIKIDKSKWNIPPTFLLLSILTRSSFCNPFDKILNISFKISGQTLQTQIPTLKFKHIPVESLDLKFKFPIQKVWNGFEVGEENNMFKFSMVYYNKISFRSHDSDKGITKQLFS